MKSKHLKKEDLDAEIKCCPFCGSDNVSLENTWIPSYWVECCDCSARAESDAGYDSSDEGHRDAALNAIEKWNSRV